MNPHGSLPAKGIQGLRDAWQCPGPCLAEAKAAGVATINYGLFLNAVVDFLIVAFAILLIVRAVNRWSSGRPAHRVARRTACSSWSGSTGLGRNSTAPSARA